jgi:hypothetical protein
MTNNTFPQTDAEIEDWIAEGELRQEREQLQAYEDAGWRDQEAQEAYERSYCHRNWTEAEVAAQSFGI